MGIGRGRVLRALRPRRGPPLATSGLATDVSDATRRYLMYVLLPAWFAPDLADWWMHRRTRIQTTSGTANR